MKTRLISLLIPSLFLIPLSAYGFTPAVGIVADGQNYTLTTSAVMGIANINSFSVDPSNSGASLQLNSIMHVITTTGTQDYLLQNVIQFPDSNSNNAYVGDYVFNVTSYGNTKYYDKYADENLFQRPLKILFATREQTIPGVGVQVQFLYSDKQTVFKEYDNKTFVIPGIISSAFLVTSNQSILNGSEKYETEFVWGGYGNGSIGNFTSMDSTLSLFYYTNVQVPQNSSQPYLISPWKPFQGYANYGRDTGEMDQNIYSTINPENNGTAVIELGKTENITISTDKLSYTNGDTIRISGIISPAILGTPMTIYIFAPARNVVQELQIDMPQNFNNSINFDRAIQTGSNSWQYSGTYTVEAYYGSNTAQTTFSFTSAPPQTTPQPNGFPSPSTYLIPGTNIAVRYNILDGNGKLESMQIDSGSKSLVIEADYNDVSLLAIGLPDSLIKFNGDPLIYIDGKKTSYYNTIKTQDGVTLDISVSSGYHIIQIFGSQVPIPEFGNITSVVFLISVITMAFVSGRARPK
ncbi:MAG: thermopsin family protease [Nitrosotalea sp.]